jgi:hypothetical protein
MQTSKPEEYDFLPDDLPYYDLRKLGYEKSGWMIRAKKIQRLGMELLESGKYKRKKLFRKGKWKWWTGCSIFMLVVARRFGCDIGPISDDDIWRSCTTMWKRSEKSYLVDAKTAYYLARFGVFVAVVSPKYMRIKGKYYNHAALVWPVFFKDYNPDVGPTIIQEGWTGGVFPISDRNSWGKVWKDDYIRYIVLPLK